MSLYRSSRFAPRWGLGALAGALVLALTLGAFPVAFAAPGDSAAEAIFIGADGRFFGTAKPGQSVWFRFNYKGGGEPATIAVSYEPATVEKVDLEVYTGTPPNVRREETSAARSGNTLSITFTDPNARDVFVRVVNEGADRTIAFTGQVSPPDVVVPPPAGTPAPPTGPVANSPQEAITVGADGFLVGTLAPQRAVWYRFWYGNPGAEATVSVSLLPDADETALNLYTGTDLNNLQRQEGSAARSSNTLVRRVNLSSAQWVYFTVVNTKELVTVAYSGRVSPAFAPPATPTPVPQPTATPVPVAAPPMPKDARYFFPTQYRIDHDPFWDFFRRRGAIETFGYPVSRTFTFLGCTTQVFQRKILQQCGSGPVQLINLLDPEIFPYTRVNGSVFPDPNEELKRRTPDVGSPNYPERILAFVREVAPDTWEGLPVNFEQTFFTTVSPAEAGTDNPAILGLLALEIWGAPISHPQRDPTNPNFVYQRFQRGIMHFDATTGLTQGILLADYLKQILRNSDELPADLKAQAQGSRLFAQYCPGAAPDWVCRPSELPGTNLTFAFERG